DPQYMRHAGAQYLPHAYLLCLLYCHKGDHAVQSQAADENGDPRKDLYQPQQDGLCLVERRNAVIHECIRIVVFRIQVIPELFHGGQETAGPRHIQLDGAIAVTAIVRRNAHGGYAALEGIVMKVLYHTYDGAGGTAFQVDAFADDLLRRGKVELMDEHFIDEEF